MSLIVQVTFPQYMCKVCVLKHDDYCDHEDDDVEKLRVKCLVDFLPLRRLTSRRSRALLIAPTILNISVISTRTHIISFLHFTKVTYPVTQRDLSIFIRHMLIRMIFLNLLFRRSSLCYVKRRVKCQHFTSFIME